jgi:hypothetical protein
MTPDEMRTELLRRQLAARQAQVKASQQPSRPKWTENIWGAGEADTMGEKIGQTINDMGAAVGSGIVRGTTALLDAPGALASGAESLAIAGLEKAGVPPKYTAGVKGSLTSMPFGGGDLAASAVDMAAPQVRGFEPQTTAGEYAQTVGEFLPGAMIGPGNMAGNAIRYGVLPGLASEAAGQATEGTAYEPYARIAAALGTPLLTGRPTQNAAPILPRVDPEDAKMAETLMAQGIRPTVGQTTGSDFLRRMEGTLDVLPNQADDVTRAAMTTTGSAATRATPEALKQASDDIVSTMNAAVDGVSFKPSAAMAQQADGVVNDYLRSTAQGSVVPDVRNIADEITEAATNPNAAQLDLATLKDWRSRLGKLLQSSDAQAREAAWGLRSIIDDATEAQLTAVGRADDVQRLNEARAQYRNWIAIADSATRAGAESGILSPTQLYQSVIRSQGRRNVATGNTTELGELARSAAGVLRPASTVSAGGIRSVSPQIISGLMGAGVANAMLPGSPMIATLLGAGLGAGATSAGQAIMRSTPVQSLLMDPKMRIAQSLLAAPGAMAGQQP